jgi:flagellar basal body rod protein FlgG
VAGSYADWREGVLSTTSDPFNVALSGPGFLTVQTENGDRYWRGGRMKVDEAGQLATSEGQKILGAGNSPIDVKDGTFELDEQGNVYLNGANAGTLKMVEFEDPRQLSRDADGLYTTGESDATPKEAADTRVFGGMLELSNVQMPYEMAQMISGLRAYGAYQRVINTSDETLGRLIDQVAMPS